MPSHANKWEDKLEDLKQNDYERLGSNNKQLIALLIGLLAMSLNAIRSSEIGTLLSFGLISTKVFLLSPICCWATGLVICSITIFPAIPNKKPGENAEDFFTRLITYRKLSLGIAYILFLIGMIVSIIFAFEFILWRAVVK